MKHIISEKKLTMACITALLSFCNTDSAFSSASSCSDGDTMPDVQTSSFSTLMSLSEEVLGDIRRKAESAAPVHALFSKLESDNQKRRYQTKQAKLDYERAKVLLEKEQVDLQETKRKNSVNASREERERDFDYAIRISEALDRKEKSLLEIQRQKIENDDAGLDLAIKKTSAERSVIRKIIGFGLSDNYSKKGHNVSMSDSERGLLSLKDKLDRVASTTPSLRISETPYTE